MLKERLALLQKETGEVLTWGMEKAEVLTDFCALVFTIQAAEAEGGTGNTENHSQCRTSSLRPSKEPAAARVYETWICHKHYLAAFSNA